ncbi:tail fiber protein [Vibrio sp. 10N.261.55.A10]|uniref:tail fiber protein n=1 Tax=Vibrio sp. 10N.261.55.A10 TaxID=3229687 RepID=UPI00354AD8C5
MSLLITDAGIAASIRAGELGISYKIAEISIGTEGYAPTADQTDLRNEVQRKAITRGEVTALGRLHFETVWDGSEAFEGKELGYWLDDGTLFAVDSRDGEVITYKRKDTVVIEACEINLAASTIDNISVELLEAYSATEDRSGIAKIARDTDIDAGIDDSAFLTIKKLLQRTATNVRAGVVQLTDETNSSSRLLAASANGLKAAYDLAASKMSQQTADERYQQKNAKATMTTNDGYGNASSTYNHASGTPVIDGSSYRFETSVDLDSASAHFSMASNVTAGVAITLTRIYSLTMSAFDVKVNLLEKGQRVYSPNNKPPMIGEGQSIKPVARQSNVVYTNNTGRSIYVFARVYSVDSHAYLDFYIDGKLVAANGNTAINGMKASVSALVPKGSTYKIHAQSGTLYVHEIRE